MTGADTRASPPSAAAPGAGYVGRFAPSPTGPLHRGSLLAALASWLEARAAGGRWLVRIEDLDPPREQAGAAAGILADLEAFGLEWDGAVEYQSQRHHLFDAALARLAEAGRTYRCACSRRQLAARGAAGVYDGHCRRAASDPGRAAAVRVHVDPGEVGFEDAVQGRVVQRLEQACGDFVVRRKDGLFAYQLAVVVDDEDQGVTHVVRGSDLVDSTPRQLALQGLLGYRTPAYAHLPVLVDGQGQKLSKQTRAPAVDPARAGEQLWVVLSDLGQAPPQELRAAPAPEVLAWAREAWRLERVPRRESVPA